MYLIPSLFEYHSLVSLICISLLMLIKWIDIAIKPRGFAVVKLCLRVHTGSHAAFSRWSRSLSVQARLVKISHLVIFYRY